MSSNVVFCDLDGVLAEWSRAFSSLIAEEFGTQVLETEQVPNWAWDGVLEKKHFSYGWSRVRSSHNWWTRLEPIVDPETMDRIARVHRELPIVFVTARTPSSGESVQIQSIRWLEAQGVRCPLVITRESVPSTGLADKSGLIETFQPRAIIDDAPKTALDFAARDVPVLMPSWPYTLTTTHPNIHHYDTFNDALDWIGAQR